MTVASEKELSTEEEDVSDSDADDRRSEERLSLAQLLVETARSMHQLMLDQFSSQDRIQKYTDLLKEGAGKGKSAHQENLQFGPVLELLQCQCQGDCK